MPPIQNASSIRPVSAGPTPSMRPSVLVKKVSCMRVLGFGGMGEDLRQARMLVTGSSGNMKLALLIPLAWQNPIVATKSHYGLGNP